MSELRYAFGQNWREFVDQNLSDIVVAKSVGHLSELLRSHSLEGTSFLDIGCGSGIHSLAALRLGAERVVSFDYDDASVETTKRVRAWAGIGEDRWRIFQGSVLDGEMLDSLGKFDTVYSWGVLHHTGEMWKAVRNAMRTVSAEGEFYISLYSSDIYVDPSPAFWVRLKRAYNQATPLTRKLMEIKYTYWQLIGNSGLTRIKNYGHRGMNWLTDVKDWLGGYPIEFASFAETRSFCQREGGLDLVNVRAGEGCTEYVFARANTSPKWRKIEADRIRQMMKAPFRHQDGAAWRYSARHLSGTANSAGKQSQSTVMVYEDGQPLGLAHAQYADIARLGGGRFNHTRGVVVFSTSDNSDPNTNGRRYSLCEAY